MRTAIFTAENTLVRPQIGSLSLSPRDLRSERTGFLLCPHLPLPPLLGPLTRLLATQNHSTSS
jgi:hypothetical protein